jgi:probable rRNA maturation factor
VRISVYDRQKALPICKEAARLLVKVVLDIEKASYKQASLYFVSSKTISKIHQDFFSDPTPTDTISFPIDKEHLGEVFVCPEVAIQYGARRNIDPYEETALYAIHGLLHCLGYDDLKEKDRRIMRKKEKTCMAQLRKLGVHLKP